MSTHWKLRGLALAFCVWAAGGLSVSAVAAQDQFGELESDQTSGDEYGSSSEDEAATEDASEEEDAEPATAAARDGDVRVQVFAGAGIGTRALRRPITHMGVQRLDDVLFPGLDAGLRVTAWPAEAFSLEFLLHYQTSLGMRIEQPPMFALGNDIAVRAERVEISMAPEFRLGDTPSSTALLFPIGFGLRTFWPEVHTLPVPGYSLGGPLLRAELAIPVLEGVTLRFGPEAQWIFMIDQSIEDQGVGSQGVALGGEALLQFQVSTLLGIEVAFRESHALVPTTVKGETFVDIERFVTGRLSGTW